MKVIIRFNALLLLSLLTFGPFALRSQLPGGSPAGMDIAMIKLFGNVGSFTAKASVQVLDKDQKETMSVPMDFSLLDQKVRVELDITQIKSELLAQDVATGLKQMGLAQVISIIRPDRNSIYVIYPTPKCYMTTPMPKEDSDTLKADHKIEKTVLGKETIDGHPCTKTKILIKGDAAKPLEATTWNATDLKDFPIQIESKNNENTSIIHYKDVRFTKLDPKQFEPPEGYTAYKDQSELMVGLMKKAVSGSETNAPK
jgi:hypothetical protein